MPFLGTLVLPRSEYKRKRNDRKEKKRNRGYDIFRITILTAHKRKLTYQKNIIDMSIHPFSKK